MEVQCSVAQCSIVWCGRPSQWEAGTAGSAAQPALSPMSLYAMAHGVPVWPMGALFSAMMMALHKALEAVLGLSSPSGGLSHTLLVEARSQSSTTASCPRPPPPMPCSCPPLTSKPSATHWLRTLSAPPPTPSDTQTVPAGSAGGLGGQWSVFHSTCLGAAGTEHFLL